MAEPTLLEELWANRGLVFLFTAFAAAVVFTFRPGSGKIHRDTSDIPFRHEDKPASGNFTEGYSEEARS